MFPFCFQRCVNFAFEARDFNMAACLAYVVDRATYWSGASKALLQVVDLIKQTDPLVAIAPQIQVREARVLKDEGDLHGAMNVLNNILERRQDQPGTFDLKFIYILAHNLIQFALETILLPIL
jgi:hypothetical protein